MSEIIEDFFQGYCKAYDMARTAIGEFTKVQGEWILDQIDCDYGTCMHSENCQMMKQVFQYLEQKNKEIQG